MQHVVVPLPAEGVPHLSSAITLQKDHPECVQIHKWSQRFPALLSRSFSEPGQPGLSVTAAVARGLVALPRARRADLVLITIMRNRISLAELF